MDCYNGKLIFLKENQEWSDSNILILLHSKKVCWLASPRMNSPPGQKRQPWPSRNIMTPCRHNPPSPSTTTPHSHYSAATPSNKGYPSQEPCSRTPPILNGGKMVGLSNRVDSSTSTTRSRWRSPSRTRNGSSSSWASMNFST